MCMCLCACVVGLLELGLGLGLGSESLFIFLTHAQQVVFNAGYKACLDYQQWTNHHTRQIQPSEILNRKRKRQH